MIGKSGLEVIIDGQNLDYDNCVAVVSKDGRRFMLSKRCGAVKEMQSKIKNAILCPCSNHTLNLSLAKYAKV